MKNNETALILLLSFLPFVMVVGNSMFIPILPTIESDLSLTSGEAGLLLTSFSIPAALMIPFIGYLSDRHGRKRVILFSLSFVCLGSLVSLLSHVLSDDKNITYPILLLGRVIQGLGAGGTTPLAMAVIGDIFIGKQRSTALGTVEVFNGLGKMLSPFIGIIAVMLVWYSAFVFYFVVAAITFIGIYWYVKLDKPISNIKLGLYILSIGTIVKREYRWLLPVYFTGGVLMFILFGLLIYLAYEAERVYHVDALMKGFLFLLPLGMLTVSSYFSGRIIGGGITRIKIMISLGFSIILLVLLGGMLVHSFTMLVLIMTLFSVGVGFLLPCCNFFVTGNVSNKERGMVVSLYGMVRFLGVAFGPLVYSYWMYNEWWLFMYSFLIVTGVLLWLYTGWLSMSKQNTISPFAT